MAGAAGKYVAGRFPARRDAPTVETRVCQYENTSNGDFLIDRHPEMENVWFAGGGSGHGVKNGPAVGGDITGPMLVGALKGVRRFAGKENTTQKQRARWHPAQRRRFEEIFTRRQRPPPV